MATGFGARAMTIAIAAGSWLFATPDYSHAGVSLRGDSKTIEMNVENSPLVEVLHVIASNFAVDVNSRVDLSVSINGTFRGSISEVLSRLLRSYDYVLKHSTSGRLQLVIIRRSGLEPKVAPATAAQYPDPAWRAKSYSRGLQPTPSRVAR